MAETATRNHHPSRHKGPEDGVISKVKNPRSLILPSDVKELELNVGGRKVKLTNLPKLFWPSPKITKRDLLQYYIDVSPYLLPHLHDRAMVMKRYPNGSTGEFFFMKHAPKPRPNWIEICSIAHQSKATVSTPVTWEEIEKGIKIENFRMDNVPQRLAPSVICGSRFFTKGEDSSSRLISECGALYARVRGRSER